MLIDVTQDNLYISLCSRKLRADKTSYIEEVDNAVSEGHNFISLCAPGGLGVSTFADMVGAFYNEKTETSVFWGTDIVKSADTFAKRGRYAVLTFDFMEVNNTTQYNRFITDLCEQTAQAIRTLYPETGKLPKYDWAAQLKTLSADTGRKLVLIFKNFDRVLRFVTRTADFLNAWRRLWAGLIESSRRDGFIYLALAGTHIPGITDMLVHPEHPGAGSLFYNLSSEKQTGSTRMFGWCGITFEEMTTILKASFSELDSDELYDWCGHYDGGLVKPSTLFTSIEARDMFITSNVSNAIWFVRDSLGSGTGAYLLCGDIGVARLLNGEVVNMKEVSQYDPRVNTGYAREIYAYTRRFLQILYAEGLVSLVTQTDSRLDVAELVNTEIVMAVADEVNSNSDYLRDLCSLVSRREQIEQAIEDADASVLGEGLRDYLLLQKKYLGNRSSITIWQAVYDFISDMENYEIITFGNIFILKDIGGSESYSVIAVAVNVDENRFLDETLNLRLRSGAFRKLINGYTGRICVMAYNFVLSNDSEPKVSARSALLA